MRHLFVDTFYLIALAHPRDQWRERVVTLSRSLRDYRLYTVDEVLAEFLTACSASGPRIRQHAVRTVWNALQDRQWMVLPQSRSSLLEALALYEARPDKEYSLTDCISMQVMRREGLMEVLTNDHHFTQEGFHILFPSPSSPSPFNMDSSLVRNCHLVCSSVVCPSPADTPTASTTDGGHRLAKCVCTVYPPQSGPPRRNVGAQGTRHAQTQETAWPRQAHAAAIWAWT